MSHNRQSIISELLNLVDKIKDLNLIMTLMSMTALRDLMQIDADFMRFDAVTFGAVEIGLQWTASLKTPYTYTAFLMKPSK